MMFTTGRAAARLHSRNALPPRPGPRGQPSRSPLRLAGRGAGTVLRLVGAAFAAWRSRRERQAAIGDLRSWNDNMLKDIGLTRGEIVAAVDGQLQRGGPQPTTAPHDARPGP